MWSIRNILFAQKQSFLVIKLQENPCSALSFLSEDQFGHFKTFVIISSSIFGVAFLYFFVMFSATVWKKYIFRVLKLITLVFLCQQVINAKLLGKSSKDFNAFYTINNIICIASGAANTYLLHSSLKGNSQNLWLTFNLFKLVTAMILFTPVGLYVPISISKNSRVNMQFYWMIVMLVLSPLARYYRETNVIRQRQLEQKS